MELVHGGWAKGTKSGSAPDNATMPVEFLMATTALGAEHKLSGMKPRQVTPLESGPTGRTARDRSDEVVVGQRQEGERR